MAESSRPAIETAPALEPQDAPSIEADSEVAEEPQAPEVAPTSKPLGLIVHTAAAQAAGYPLHAYVIRDGAIWRNKVPNNPHPPGNLATWEFWG